MRYEDQPEASEVIHVMPEGAADHLIYILADKDPICLVLALQTRIRSFQSAAPWPLSQHGFLRVRMGGAATSFMVCLTSLLHPVQLEF